MCRRLDTLKSAGWTDEVGHHHPPMMRVGHDGQVMETYVALVNGHEACQVSFFRDALTRDQADHVIELMRQISTDL